MSDNGAALICQMCLNCHLASLHLHCLNLSRYVQSRRIISLMSKLGVVGSTVAQQILLLVVSTFGAGKERVLWFLLPVQLCWLIIGL